MTLSAVESSSRTMPQAKTMRQQLSLFPETMRLQRIVPEKNCWRFYRLHLETDLFGSTVLVRSWGRIGTAGQERREPCQDAALAQKALMRWARSKMRRGYAEET
ncbi:WGR domain-containing protein [Neokomagataea thailandica]|uniref:WGR domain-containing protein n=1 Tax=Neokomagataea TaxID=1223423 RepID=UPI00278C60A4|nr:MULTISPECIES: WGR domain-containing protein [Neokomagataea]